MSLAFNRAFCLALSFGHFWASAYRAAHMPPCPSGGVSVCGWAELPVGLGLVEGVQPSGGPALRWAEPIDPTAAQLAEQVLVEAWWAARPAMLDQAARKGCAEAAALHRAGGWEAVNSRACALENASADARETDAWYGITGASGPHTTGSGTLAWEIYRDGTVTFVAATGWRSVVSPHRG